ncbi:MAG TPA: tetratricopeptide repeat protein [Terriglobales bacterium]
MTHLFLLAWLLWQTASPEAVQHMNAGIEAEKQRHVRVAIAEFKKVTELEPSLAIGFVRLGQAYMENHEFGSAIPILKQALQLDANLIPAHRLLGYALLAQGYSADAIPHFEKAQEQAALGIAQTNTGQFSEAVSNLQAALAKQPNDPDLLYYLGRASGLLSKQNIDTMMSLYPDSPRAHQAMGENYFVLRQMPQAEREFREALKLQPNLPEVHMELGTVYAGSAEWDKAEAEFRAQTRLQPGNAEAAFRLGSSLLQQGRAHEAREELQRANRLLPDMPETLYSLGKAASLEGDTKSAEDCWNKVISLEKASPLAAQAHFGLAAIYRKQGKTTEAAREMQEFQKLQSAPAAGKDTQQ